MISVASRAEDGYSTSVMARINENFQKLKAGYLFPEIARRVNAYTESEPEKAKQLIRCGIGDVTEPVPVAAREAMKKAVDELGDRGSFRGYGPEQDTLFFVNQLLAMLMADLESILVIFLFLTALNVIPETFSISLARGIKSR